MRGDLNNWIYSGLDEDQLGIMAWWYEDTERRQLIGEMSAASMGVILGLIGGSKITRVVQLGTYAGWSSLLVGFCLERHDGRLWTCDIDAEMAEYSREWIQRSELDDYVASAWCNSTRQAALHEARVWLGGNPELVIVDSSHQYQQTLDEIDVWWNHLMPGGLMVFHDSSNVAREYDTTGEGGVGQAFGEWAFDPDDQENAISLNYTGAEDVFKDPCGLALVQKPI